MKDIRSELKVLLDAEKVQNRIAELAVEISNDFKNKPVKIICVLRGGTFFTVDLTKKLDLIFDMDFVEISSYGDGRESSGNIVVKKDLTDISNGRYESRNIFVSLKGDTNKDKEYSFCCHPSHIVLQNFHK